MSPLALVELDKLARLCRASSILSFTVVGLDATISSYSDILVTYSNVSAKILGSKTVASVVWVRANRFRPVSANRTYKSQDKVRTFR